MEIFAAVAAVANLHQVRVRFDPLCAQNADSMHGWIAINLATDCNAYSTSKIP
jgi:hypothetical protein